MIRYVQRMAEGSLPKISLKWMPKQKRARGRPKKNWMEGIKAMNERSQNEGQWEDRKQWSLGVGQRRKTFCKPIYTYIRTLVSTKIHRPEIFLSPKPEVTFGTVAIIIRVVLLSPYLRIRAVSLSSIHYNPSHRVHINRRRQYICLI